MTTLKNKDVLTAGLAIFAMFFGAGNIIFPLALGTHALDQSPYALAGLLLTAVAMPFAGLFAMFRCGGETSLFFDRVGKIPGFCIALLTITLLGPFGAAPRCIALAYSTLSTSLPQVSLILFSALSCALIFCFAYRENQTFKLIGSVLSPFKVALLSWIIVKGLMDAPAVHSNVSDLPAASHFWHGLTEGYNTMDLLAAFFFAPIILTSLGKREKSQDFSRFLLKASAIGASLLSVVYIGFCLLSYLFAPDLEGLPSDRLLGAIAIRVLGEHAGLIVSLTVTLACLTTAIALLAAFATFVHKEVVKERVTYLPILIGTLLATFATTTLEFQGIARLLHPVLQLCYPGLILLTLYNLFAPVRVQKVRMAK